MIKINIILNNRAWYNYIKNPSKLIEKKHNLLNKKFKKYKKNIFFCSLLLSGDAEIKRLNKKFRKKNKSTDVLSFPFYEKKKLIKKIKKEKEIYIGDIIINLNKIKEKHSKIKFKQELTRLWVHGFTHLLGYDHKKDKEFYKMRKVEKKIFQILIK